MPTASSNLKIQESPNVYDKFQLASRLNSSIPVPRKPLPLWTSCTGEVKALLMKKTMGLPMPGQDSAKRESDAARSFG